jgi:amidase
MDSDGMPLSMQLVGPHLGEAALIRAAAAYQGVTDWHRKQPDID